MFNGVRQQLKIPTFFEKMSITRIYKSKGCTSDLSNDRGIFNVAKLRSMLDKLLYADTYKVIDPNLSCSNVGGRQGRNIRDHLFVVYGIVNDVKNGQADPIDIQGYDITKCFDEMGYEETHNDLWDVGINDDKFALIAKLDENAQVVVNTLGSYQPVQFEEICATRLSVRSYQVLCPNGHIRQRLSPNW